MKLTISRLKTTSKDFKKLVNSQEFADIQFKVQDQTIYAHKNILSIRSIYFNRLFKSGMRESSDGIIHITDISYAGLIALLTFLYTNQLEVSLSYNGIYSVRLTQISQ